MTNERHTLTRPRGFACSYYSMLPAPCQCAHTPSVSGSPGVAGGQGENVRDNRDEGEYSDSPSSGPGDETAEPTIVIEDEGLRLGFTQLPNYLFQVRGLSHSAKLTYALILSYAWQKEYCFPGQETLARDLEVSTRSVIEYLKELQNRGLIRIQRRGLGKTNVYHVLRYPPTPDNPAPAPIPRPAPTRPIKRVSHQEVKPSSHQGLKTASHPEMRGTSHPEVRGAAYQEVRQTAGNKKTLSAKNTRGNEKEQQKRAVAPDNKRQTKGSSGQETPPTALGRLFPSVDVPTDVASAPAANAAMARTALQAHGIRNERLLTELTSDPGEVLAQIERLRQEVARGAVANPAGWLVEAIRGRYRPADQDDDAPAIAGTGAALQDGSGAAGAPDGGITGATPEGRAWARVCAELRDELTPENYGRWFAPAVAQAYSGDRLTVGVPDAFHLQWLDRRLRNTIERAAARVLGDVTIAFVVGAG